MNHRPGSKIKAAREARQWSLAHVSRLTDIVEGRLSVLENNERPVSDDEWDALSALLEITGPKPERAVLPAVRKVWRVPEPRLTEDLVHPAALRLRAACSTFGGAAEQALEIVEGRRDRNLCREFLEQARMDSGDEAKLWLDLLAAGAAPCRIPPIKVGFRKHAIVDPSSKQNISDRRQPCLEHEFGRVSCLLFPQLTLDVRRAYYRLDALLLAASGRDSLWLNLEVDGQGHDPAWDRERQIRLGLPTIRLGKSHLSVPDTPGALQSRILALMGLSEAG